jgi:pilus assembly protein Flp/PilA
MNSLITRLLVEEEGADATEYALLAALIAIALIFGATALGTKINGVFNNVQGHL